MSGTFTKKDRLMHWAAQLDQISREIREAGKDMSLSMNASHEYGVISSNIMCASRRLNKFANKVGA